MSANELKDRLQRRPFQPFRVLLSSGGAYEVRHPEMALLGKGGIYVAVPDPKEDLPDITWYSLLHIAAIEPADSKSTGNPRTE